MAKCNLVNIKRKHILSYDKVIQIKTQEGWCMVMIYGQSVISLRGH